MSRCLIAREIEQKLAIDYYYSIQLNSNFYMDNTDNTHYRI